MKKQFSPALILFLLLLVSSGLFAASRNRINNAEADPGRPAESPSHFTLPVGLPFGNPGTRDSNFTSGKKDTAAGMIIKGQQPSKKKVYQFSIGNENDPADWRQTEEAFRQAQDMNADYLLIHVDDGNAYTAVNKIRSRLFHYKTPVLLYVDDHSGTAGSVIPLSKDTLRNLDAVLKNAKQQKKERNERDHAGVSTRLGLNNKGLAKKCLRNSDDVNGSVITSNENVKTDLNNAGIVNIDLIDYQPTLSSKLIEIITHPVGIFFFLFLFFSGIYLQFRSVGNGAPMFMAACAGLLLFSASAFEGNTEYGEFLLFMIGLALICIGIYGPGSRTKVIAAGLGFLFAGITLLLLPPLSGAGPGQRISIYFIPFLAALTAFYFSSRIEKGSIAKVLSEADKDHRVGNYSPLNTLIKSEGHLSAY